MTFILDALRLPIGKANGIYKKQIPEKLMAHLIEALAKRSPLPIQEVILANAFGTGGNMARYAALEAGFNIPAVTIDSQCSGGLRAVEIAHLMAQENVIIAGGMESKSTSPKKAYHIDDPRFNAAFPFFTTASFAPNQSADFTLVQAAENVAKKYAISKEKMVKWTQNSHYKAASLQAKNALAPFIHKIEEHHYDQSIKEKTDFKLLSTQNLIDRTTSAHYNDGAAAVVLGPKTNNQKPLARIISSSTISYQPDYAPESIIEAVKSVLKKAQMSISDINIFEINESFSLIPLIFTQLFEADPAKVNLLGGTLAYGHPFGASGTINLIHLIAALKMQQASTGLVVIPAAGGQATAMILENAV